MSQVPARLTWRAPWAYRIFFGGMGLFFLVGAVLPWEDTMSSWDGMEWRILTVVIGIVLIACGWRPVVKLLEDLVFARSVVLSRTVRLADLKSVESGRYGLTLVEDDGRQFKVSFIGEKATYAAGVGKETRADSKAQILVTVANEWRDGRDDETGAPRRGEGRVQNHQQPTPMRLTSHDPSAMKRVSRPARGQRTSWSRRASRRPTVPSTSVSLSRPKSPIRKDEKSSPSPHMSGTPAAT